MFSAFSQYATQKNPGKGYEVWEDALVSYMKDNPIDGLRLVVQEIANGLPSKVDRVRMQIIEPQIRGILQRFGEVGKENVPALQENLIKLVSKGLDIKNPTEEFVALLEEAAKNI